MSDLVNGFFLPSSTPALDMPQDNLRAAVYRSLNKTIPVGCEVQNDTVECGTIGRSKASSSLQVERRGHPAVDQVLAYGGEEEEEAMAYKEDSELQLLKVSRGAHKLTQMIDSWSKAPGIDGRSRDITRDLLQGALDLQESLMMLGKLQEASKLMSMKKKQNQSFLDEREGCVEKIGVEEMCSRRFSVSGYHNRMQERRLSVDGSSRDCIEELRKVIRESFRRQNLLSVSSDDEKGSSSPSLRFPPSVGFMEERRGASAPAAAQQNKPRAPNLIARLMGLEDVSSKIVQPIRREEEKKKRLKPPRPTFDIEMPRPRNVHVIEQSPDPKRKTLEKIIQKMKFKGLLKSDQLGIQSRTSDLRLECHGKDFAKNVEAPPIVIMKPLHLPILDGGVHKDPHWNKIPVKEEVHQVKLMQEKGQSVHLFQEESVQLVEEERVLNHGRMMSKKVERRELKSMEKSKVEVSQKAKPLDSLHQKPQGKEAIKTRKKTDMQTKTVLTGGRMEEKKGVEAIKSPVSQAKTSTTLAKFDRKISSPRNNASTCTSAPRNCYQSSPNITKLNQLCEEKEDNKPKPVKKSSKTAKDDKKCKEDAKEIGPPCNRNSVSTKSNNLPDEDPPKMADQDPRLCVRAEGRKDQKILCKVMPTTSLGGRSPGLAEEAIQNPDKRIASISKAAGLEIDLKQLLLSSQPFLSYAQEFLCHGSHRPIYRTKGIDKLGTKNAKLFLDCVKEIMARKSYQRNLLNHPMLQNQIWTPKVCSSLDQLVEEISNGIEKLLSYNKIVDEEDVNSENSLYIRLGKDLRCKDMLINTLWDVAWGTWISMEEADQVVGAVEELILSWLIEEVVMDLVL